MKLYVDLTRKDLARLVEGRSVEKKATGMTGKDPTMVAIRNTKKKGGRQ